MWRCGQIGWTDDSGALFVVTTSRVYRCGGWQVDQYPNVTVKDFGSVKGADDMAKEIFTRGLCG